jgi:hypothetical protein
MRAEMRASQRLHKGVHCRPERESRGRDAMREPPSDAEYSFNHALTVFSVSAGMIGVCLTAIGLVKIVTKANGFDTLCDDLIAIDAMVFGLAALLGFRGLQQFIRHQSPLSLRLMDSVFLVGLALTIVNCAVFTWYLL